MNPPELIQGQTVHIRRGAIANAFSYRVDYAMLDPDRALGSLWLFSRNRFNLAALHDADHGGPRKAGQGTSWVRGVLEDAGLAEATRITLLAQPRILGHVFNPVSFWLCRDESGALRAVIAEVNNTYGDRHSYLCCRDDREPIGRSDVLQARKIFHVSPFQPMDGRYRFRFDLRDDRIGIWIDLASAHGGVFATLTGRRVPMTDRRLLAAALARPFGSRRVLGLIHWQALKLWWKGARWHVRPEPPATDVSTGSSAARPIHQEV